LAITLSYTTKEPKQQHEIEVNTKKNLHAPLHNLLECLFTTY